jgi:hypothetical protein
MESRMHRAHHDRNKYLHVATVHLKRMLDEHTYITSAKLKLSCNASMQIQILRKRIHPIILPQHIADGIKRRLGREKTVHVVHGIH